MTSSKMAPTSRTGVLFFWHASENPRRHPLEGSKVQLWMATPPLGVALEGTRLPGSPCGLRPFVGQSVCFIVGYSSAWETIWAVELGGTYTTVSLGATRC